MTADRRMDAFLFSSSVRKDAAAELAEARLAGEGDELFACRLARLRITNYIEACSALSTFRVNGSSSEVKRKAESDVRKAMEYLQGAATLLNESVNKAEVYNGR